MAAESDEQSTSDSSEDEEEIDLKSNNLRTFVDFESDDSAPNVVVRSFFRDCYYHPKILCHKDFLFFRTFLEKVGGMSFTLPLDSPYHENHDDTTFCVDLDDKMLVELKRRFQTANDELWASIIPLQRRNDLGLSIFKWNLVPMTMCYLQLYIDYCRQRLRESEPEKEQNVDEYVLEFSAKFNIARNKDVEDTLKGDIEATRLRKLSNKVEPSSNLDFETINKECPSPPKAKTKNKLSASTKKKAKYNDKSDSSSETDSSSQESNCSEYKGKYSVKKKKSKKRNGITTQMAKVANGVIKKPSSGKPNGAIRKPSSVKANGAIRKPSSVKPNGAIRKPPIGKPNGAIKKLFGGKPNGTVNKVNGVIKKPSSGKPNGVTPNGIHKSPISPPGPLLRCNICQPRRHFSTKRILYKHMTQFHSTARRCLVTCKCGSKIRKERYEFHKEFCKKHVIVIS
ncbi:unnamed protein product [Orchesella dallaii]|uniref:Uncharacterized protein n=1 Tax=Orchesella dallaii TaxID=48710 RepID=A0ABP1RNM8_9HEXA